MQTYRFHELVLNRCGNKTLAVQGAVLADIVASHLALSIGRNVHRPITLERFRRTITSYEGLVDLVQSRSVEAAEAHWRNHMEVAAKSLLQDDLKSKPVVDLFS
jgi:GntR family transcriptional regulator, transcriptional repressor for pyruvate dehydrogenase complex